MRGAALALSYKCDARDKLRSLVARYPALLEGQYFSEVVAIIEEYGYLSLCPDPNLASISPSCLVTTLRI